MRVGVEVGVGVCQPVTVCLERVGFILLNLTTWPLHLSRDVSKDGSVLET